MYWILFSCLLFPSCFVTKKNEVKFCFFFFSIILILFLSFKFGIGVDYFNIFQTYSQSSNYRIPIIKTIFSFAEKPQVSLFIFFTMYYSAYLESAIRAGCVIAMFIYIYFYFFRLGETKKYYLGSLIAMGFHYSAFICFLVPINAYKYVSVFNRNDIKSQKRIIPYKDLDLLFRK